MTRASLTSEALDPRNKGVHSAEGLAGPLRANKSILAVPGGKMVDLRFAVLGTGFWSNFQIPAWFEVGGAKLVAVYNRTTSKAKLIAEKFHVPRIYSDPEELFQKEQLDFIDIITEVSAHAPLVFLAAKHKIPVICQKPMGPDLETCRKMVAACNDAGIPFMIHENYRWQTPIRALKKVLDDGTIGPILRANIRWVHFLPFLFETQRSLKTLKHFALADMGSHLLDLVRFFFGEPDYLYCQHRRSRGDIAGEDLASVMLRVGQIICTCEISYSSQTEWGHFPETLVFIEGTNGAIQLDTDYWLRITTANGTSCNRYPPPHYAWADPAWDVVHASLVSCNADLLNAIKTGKASSTSAQDNLKTMRLVYAAYDYASLNEVIVTRDT
jgi:predicted dehydrogenase